ncbi:MAG: hypothetical protein KF910_07270 [Brevundimonas sp.]|jgi:hypothetical protein|uniref:hypothetical protein n=1 Tax=Brevundimonas sp. TaxID=1871086 RepID=UPI0025BFDC0B|nr:hypothetical protein [Brevundimonas sp.]MBX3477391.1 hypothetical protein [Brevundimonas sp.]
MKGLTSSDVIAIATGLVSLAAFVVAMLSWITAHRAQRLAERQEARRAPRLDLRLINSKVADIEGKRTFVIHLQIANPTDTANSVAALELCIRHRREIPLTLLAPAVPNADESIPVLQMPLRIDAHHTVEGWVRFAVAADLLKGSTIEGYELVATDTHQEKTTLETQVLSWSLR